MADDPPKKDNSKEPFRGSDQISKNLSTLPEGDTDRADLLSQVTTDNSNTQPEPAPLDGGSDEPK